MKQRVGLLLLLFVLFLPLLAFAQEAEDLTDQCEITATKGKYRTNIDRLHDKHYGKEYVSDRAKNPYVELKAPTGKPIYGMYVCFGDKLTPWKVEARKNGKWEEVYHSEGLYVHEYAPLDGEKHIRVTPDSDKKVILTINELFAFGEGETPAFVQRWQPAPEKADLLVVAAHPDDEILFYGGAIPTYAGEKQMNVVVAYMTYSTMERRSELLNGLWEMGVRTYPVIGTFEDSYSNKLATGYTKWKKTKVDEFLVGLIRQFRPEVVLSHDVGGEYGHGAHRVCADALIRCMDSAADSGKFAASASQYGVWQAKKLYLHIYDQNPIEMDWDQPLSAFDGRTGYEVAADAYKLHVSQEGKGYKKNGKRVPFVVEPRDSQYSSYRFGLAYTTVGVDEAGNDFFEHIPGY